jgi:2-polyprenyl-3-methyl-5-hydroxy-6-metoxy-1,4-benzoquinol methylase
MDLTDHETRLLHAIGELERQQIRPTSEAIRKSEQWSRLGQDEQTLFTVLGQLDTRHLVLRIENAYSLTTEGIVLVKRLDSEWYGRWMVACEHSPAYQRFCQKVYGASRCHFNMTTEKQLGKLIEILHLGENDHVLDLGCGIGTITEHISDVTGADVVGVDFSEDAIQAARARTLEKHEHLTFDVMDMDDLHLSDGSYDAVVVIDTLYFVRDVRSVIAATKRCLRDRGRMAIFYSTIISPEEPKANLAPGGTPLANALQSCELSFQTWDFTEDERGVWERQLEAAEKLKPEFEAEGNQWIYQGRVSEARWALEYFTTGRCSRHLYHVQV